MANNTPTAEQLREVRRRGFSNSTSHLPKERADKLLKSYLPQDARRERNIQTFVSRVRG